MCAFDDARAGNLLCVLALKQGVVVNGPRGFQSGSARVLESGQDVFDARGSLMYE